MSSFIERHRALLGRAPGTRGFSLIELMVTIAVMAILMAVVVPSFTDTLLGSKLASYANSLSGSAMLARSEAIKRNATVSLCVSSTGASCDTGSWEQGWIVLSGTSVLHRGEALPAGLRITEATAIERVDFRPGGVGTTAATLTVCRQTPTVGAQERVVSISATGRTAVSKTTNASCP